MDTRKDELFENARVLIERVKKTAVECGRNPDEITIVAATKTVAPERINLLPDCGIVNIGENRVQELLEKYDKLDRQRLTLHFIGKLQTNKVKYIIDKVDMIHSVDNLKLGQEISKRALAIGKVMNILVEVNVGREQSKSGVMPENALELVEELDKLEGINVCGLMAIPPKIEDEANFFQKNSKSFNYFQIVKQLSLDISLKRVHNSKYGSMMQILSMGMSSDYPQAIENGATIIRPGRVLFGERQYF